ncbi:hypothetical protein HK102_000709, partial [Quaeritorhiza haematococci]
MAEVNITTDCTIPAVDPNYIPPSGYAFASLILTLYICVECGIQWNEIFKNKKT